MSNTLRSLCFVFLLLLIPAWGANALTSNSAKILIIANSKAPAYQQVINSFKARLNPADFKVHYLSKIDNKLEFITSEIETTQPKLIFALGVASTKVAIHSSKNIPIVSTMVVKSHFFQQASNITGVILSYPLSTQLKWLKKTLPDVNQIAILYNPKENLSIINDATKIAHKMALNITAIPVNTAKQLPYALDQLKNNVQVLLAIPDRVVMSPKTAKAVLLASFRNRVPMIGLTDNWVKAGALYALSWDYADIGQQCADQATALINGKSIKQVPLAFPEQIHYVINKTIMERMKIPLSELLLLNAKTVFE